MQNLYDKQVSIIKSNLNKMTNQDQPKPTIIMLSAACCMPGMAGFDAQAEKVIRQAMSETGVNARFEIVPATKAFFSGALRRVINELMVMANQGKMGAPAVLINGEVVSYGVPTLEIMKEALSKFKEEKQNE